ncbi:MAG: PepSY domain-containing protein [Ottowia sp.]|nr:PepSY domain-containing protein [Ottowia sp.]
MKSRISHRLLPRAARALLAVLLALGAVGVHAQGNEQDSVRAAVAAGRYRPLADILAQVERTWPGARVLDLDTKQDVQGQLYYEVKLLDRAGVKRTLLVDATTGRELDEGSTVQQAATMRELAAYLRRVEAENGLRVVEAELKLGIDGKAAYQLIQAPSVESAQRRLMDAASGDLLVIPPQEGQKGALHTMPELLEALADRYEKAAVLEVELEGVSGSTVYYEIELRVDGGAHTLELQVDARTLRVLKSSYRRE